MTKSNNKNLKIVHPSDMIKKSRAIISLIAGIAGTAATTIYYIYLITLGDLFYVHVLGTTAIFRIDYLLVAFFVISIFLIVYSIIKLKKI